MKPSSLFPWIVIGTLTVGVGCAAEAADPSAPAAADSELTAGPAPELSALTGTWSEFGVEVDDQEGHEKQAIMGLKLEASHRFQATLASVCDDDGRGLCGDAAEGSFTYASGSLELTFTTGPKTPFVYSTVRLSSKGVLQLYRDSQFAQGRPYLAGRLVRAISRTTCGGCQDVYTSCLRGGSSASCRPSFDQCIYDSTFKNFELAEADCYPREATDEACKRAQSWVKENNHDADSMKYAKQILSFYGIRQTDCPL
jgi:hypothetical protein